MAIKVNCPSCRKAYALADGMAGKRVRCKECSETIVVPAAEEDAPVVEFADKGPRADAPTARPRRRDEEDEDDRDRRPARPKKTASDGAKTALIVVLGVGFLVLIVCGGAIAGVVYAVNRVMKSVDNTVNTFKDEVEKANAPPKDVNEAVAWLNAPNDQFNRHKRAAEWLEKQPVEESKRAQVLLALANVAVDNTDPFSRDAILNALAKWADATVVDALVRSLRDGVNDRVVEALVRLRDPRGAEGLANRLGTVDHQKAMAGLRKMGPAAEDAVANQLTSNNGTIRVEACRLLEHVGTRKSVPRLREAMQKYPELKFDGEKSIKAMEKR
jgi:predicted Zn finger-like uncharacterized protein